MSTQQVPPANIWSQASSFLKASELNQAGPSNIRPISAARNFNAENPVKQVAEPVTSGLSLRAISETLTKINEATNLARQANNENGIGVLKGASNFGNTVQDLYKLMIAVGPSIKGPDAHKQLLDLAAQYTITKGSEILMPAELPSGSINYNQTKAIVAQADPTKGASVLKPIDDILGEAGGQIVGAIGAAYSIYDLAQGRTDPGSGAVQGMATGAYLGSYFGPVGIGIGAVIGGIGGAVAGLFKSGKPAEQKERDAIRKQLRSMGILDGDWNIKLANGALFDMGKDGGAKLQNLDGTERRYKEFDISNPLTEPVAQLLAPLAQAITGGSPRLQTEFTAYLTNAANSNASSIEDSIANVQVLYAQFGLSFEDVLQKMAV